MKRLYKGLIAGAMLLFLLPVVAEDKAVSEVSQAERQAITLSFYKIRPDLRIRSITPTAIDGVHQVKLDQGILYSLQGGEFFIAGDLYQVASDGIVNVTENNRKKEREQLLKTIKEDEKITFAAKDEKIVLHIFTDVDCGYCQELHSQIKDYNNLGITVKYLAFPRGGVNSRAYQKMLTTWCSDNKKAYLTQFKEGATLPFKSCANGVVNRQYQLGLTMGVTGTPAIILPTGEMQAGYLPPVELAQALGLNL